MAFCVLTASWLSLLLLAFSSIVNADRHLVGVGFVSPSYWDEFVYQVNLDSKPWPTWSRVYNLSYDSSDQSCAVADSSTKLLYVSRRVGYNDPQYYINTIDLPSGKLVQTSPMQQSTERSQFQFCFFDAQWNAIVVASFDDHNVISFFSLDPRTGKVLENFGRTELLSLDQFYSSEAVYDASNHIVYVTYGWESNSDILAVMTANLMNGTFQNSNVSLPHQQSGSIIQWYHPLFDPSSENILGIFVECISDECSYGLGCVTPDSGTFRLIGNMQNHGSVYFVQGSGFSNLNADLTESFTLVSDIDCRCQAVGTMDINSGSPLNLEYTSPALDASFVPEGSPSYLGY